VVALKQSPFLFLNKFDKHRYMTEALFESLKRELVNGYSKKRHPFRYFSLATINGERPVQRTVVLRKVLEDLSLVIYTDSRSDKMKAISTNSHVSALFYHPKKLLQVRVQAKVVIQDHESNVIWNQIPENSRKDFTTVSAPGSLIKNPDHVTYSETENYFCMLHLVPEEIEYLQLKRPNHLRVLYKKDDNAQWDAQFLVP
jgi:hypothetical protein